MPFYSNCIISLVLQLAQSRSCLYTLRPKVGILYILGAMGLYMSYCIRILPELSGWDTPASWECSGGAEVRPRTPPASRRGGCGHWEEVSTNGLELGGPLKGFRAPLKRGLGLMKGRLRADTYNSHMAVSTNWGFLSWMPGYNDSPSISVSILGPLIFWKLSLRGGSLGIYEAVAYKGYMWLIYIYIYKFMYTCIGS